MASLWPWLGIASLGALHGLSPANGWAFAAACGVHARDEAQARRALLPIAIGHGVSIALVALAFAQGVQMDRARIQSVAGALLIGGALYRLLRGADQRLSISARAGHGGVALWSFVIATAQGAGLMLVPALVPMCLSGNSAHAITASGLLVFPLAAVIVHTAAMLITTGLIAVGVCRGVATHQHLLSDTASHYAWTAAMAFTGVFLVMLR